MSYPENMSMPDSAAEMGLDLPPIPNKRLERRQIISELLGQLPDNPTDSEAKQRLIDTFDAMIEEAESTDPDTGFYNKKGLGAELPILMDLAQRSGKPLSILFIDGRKVKRINEEVDYDSGTRAILTMADAIRQSTRASDIPARIDISNPGNSNQQQNIPTRPGGDEFVVLLYGSDKYQATGVARRVQDRLTQLAPQQIPFYRNVFNDDFTVRVGIAEFNPEIDEDYNTFLGRADAAIQSAKTQDIPDVICVNDYHPESKTSEILVMKGPQIAFPNTRE